MGNKPRNHAQSLGRAPTPYIIESNKLMHIKHTRRLTAAGLGLLASLASTSSFASTCFTAFSGSTHFQFVGQPTTFTTAGVRPVVGVVFGQLGNCAGLSHWPLIGAVTVNATSAVLGFRAMTADAASCGGTDITVNLNPATLSGPMQSFNERASFGNTTTLVPAACIAAPSNVVAAEGAALAAGRDPMGNGQ